MFDFETNASVKDINVVPEQFRPLFAEDAAEKGTFRIIADDPKVKGAVEAITGLHRALRSERKANTDLKAKAVDLSPLSDYGKTPEEIASGVKAKLEEMQTQVAKGSKIDLDKIKAEITSANAKIIEGKETQIKGLTAQLETILIENALRSAIGDQAVNPDLLVPFAKNHMRTVVEDGAVRAVVVDAEGSPRFSGVNAQPMTPAELIAEMKRNPTYAPLFKSESGRGSGAPPGGSAGRQTRSNMPLSSVEKITRGLNNLR